MNEKGLPKKTKGQCHICIHASTCVRGCVRAYVRACAQAGGRAGGRAGGAGRGRAGGRSVSLLVFCFCVSVYYLFALLAPHPTAGTTTTSDSTPHCKSQARSRWRLLGRKSNDCVWATEVCWYMPAFRAVEAPSSTPVLQKAKLLAGSRALVQASRHDIS